MNRCYVARWARRSRTAVCTSCGMCLQPRIRLNFINMVSKFLMLYTILVWKMSHSSLSYCRAHWAQLAPFCQKADSQTWCQNRYRAAVYTVGNSDWSKGQFFSSGYKSRQTGQIFNEDRLMRGRLYEKLYRSCCASHDCLKETTF